MIWLAAVPVLWTVVALVLGLLVGRGIRLEGSGDEPSCPVPTEPAVPSPAAAPSSTVPAAGVRPVVAAAAPARLAAHGERQVPRAWQRSLRAAG